LFNDPSISRMQQAGADIPGWIAERYMQLPSEIPERVQNLADELTSGSETAYDKARAIETYLRTYPYNLDIPAPPPDQDVVDYFLFELTEGYCDYYATAMVILARLTGLPARLAVGYASGSYDAVNNRYIVTETDAHSWPEIYFPDIGWVSFEPTAGRPAIIRTNVDAPLTALPTLQPSEGFSLSEWLRSFTWATWVKVTALGAILLVLMWVATDFPRLRRHSPAVAIGLLYTRLLHKSQRLVEPEAGDTPYEFKDRMQARIHSLPGFTRSLLAPLLPEVDKMTDMYCQAAYSPQAPDRIKRSLAIHSWKKIRGRLWLADFWLRLSSSVKNMVQKSE
jgi:Transglutaminase-like superfamily